MDIKVSNLDVAKRVLESAKAPMKASDIATQAIRLGYVSDVTPEDFTKRLLASLSTSVKRKDSPFSRVKNSRGGFKSGVYRLKPSKSTQTEIFPSESADSEDTLFIGKGGEYAVMAELLFLGFNVSLMSVDKGVDIVAANDKEKYFHIQVKTGTVSDGNCRFNIDKSSFNRTNNSSTFYVFVLRHKKRCDFIVMPSSQITTFVNLGVITGAQKLSVAIRTEAKKYMLNGRQDITHFANGFGLIV